MFYKKVNTALFDVLTLKTWQFYLLFKHLNDLSIWAHGSATKSIYYVRPVSDRLC